MGVRTDTDARVKSEAWRNDYNGFRPHSSLGGLCPTDYASKFNEGLTLRVA